MSPFTLPPAVGHTAPRPLLHKVSQLSQAMGVDKAALAFPRAQILHPCVRKRLVCKKEVVTLGSPHPLSCLMSIASLGVTLLVQLPCMKQNKLIQLCMSSSTLSKS